MKNSPWNSAGNLEGPFFSVSFFTSFAWKSFLAIAYALIAKGVRLVCTNTIAKNARSVVQKTQGSGSLKENIITAFGSSTFSYLEPVSPSISDGCVVEGFVSKSGNRSGWNIGDRQFFFVNGRPVDMSKVGKLVNELYRGANSKQYPIAILNFNLPTRAYDVNVTPDKRKIFFSDESSILQSSREALEKIYSSNQKLKTSANELTIWEDIPLTDAEDHGAAKDQPVPMSLEQSEFEMMEKNQMPKLKTYLKRGCFDVVGYVEDIYAYYNKMEISSCVSPRYMAHQFDINERMRAILIDWLIECRARSYAASDPSDMSEARKTWRRVSKDERKSMVEDYVNKYREMNAGKFPTAYDAKKDVGGSY